MNGYAPMSRMAHHLALTQEEKARFLKEGCIGYAPEAPKRAASEGQLKGNLHAALKRKGRVFSPTKLQLLTLAVGASTVVTGAGATEGNIKNIGYRADRKFTTEHQPNGSLKVTRKA